MEFAWGSEPPTKFYTTITVCNVLAPCSSFHEKFYERIKTSKNQIKRKRPRRNAHGVIKGESDFDGDIFPLAKKKKNGVRELLTFCSRSFILPGRAFVFFHRHRHHQPPPLSRLTKRIINHGGNKKKSFSTFSPLEFNQV